MPSAFHRESITLAASKRRGLDGEAMLYGVTMKNDYHSDMMPLYLVALFAKNEQANLSKADRNGLAKLVDTLVATWIER